MFIGNGDIIASPNLFVYQKKWTEMQIPTELGHAHKMPRISFRCYTSSEKKLNIVAELFDEALSYLR